MNESGETMSEDQTIREERHGRVALLIMERPPANALSQAFLKELGDAFARLKVDDTVKVIVITGSGKFFSAGADLKEMHDALGNAEKGRAMARVGQETFDRIEGMRKPVIAAINGFALGGGLELALSAHLRFVAETAKLGLPETKLGLIPGYGGTQRFLRLAGVPRALEWILSGEQMRATEAERLGLVNRVIHPDRLLTDTLQFAAALAEEKSASAMAAALSAIYEGQHVSLEEGLIRERDLFADLFQGEDAKEGVRAFLEKRPAHFRH